MSLSVTIDPLKATAGWGRRIWNRCTPTLGLDFTAGIIAHYAGKRELPLTVAVRKKGLFRDGGDHEPGNYIEHSKRAAGALFRAGVKSFSIPRDTNEKQIKKLINTLMAINTRNTDIIQQTLKKISAITVDPDQKTPVEKGTEAYHELLHNPTDPEELDRRWRH